jgi:hypothetical protein
VNPLRGEGRLQAGDKTYRLAFDVNAFCFAESALEPMTTDDIVAEIAGGTAKMTILRAVTWAALQKHHPETHLVHAAEIMSDAGMPAVRQAIADGLKAAFGLATEDKEDENPPKSEDGDGSISSRSGAKQGSSQTHSGAKAPA